MGFLTNKQGRLKTFASDCGCQRLGSAKMDVEINLLSTVALLFSLSGPGGKTSVQKGIDAPEGRAGRGGERGHGLGDPFTADPAPPLGRVAALSFRWCQRFTLNPQPRRLFMPRVERLLRLNMGCMEAEDS